MDFDSSSDSYNEGCEIDYLNGGSVEIRVLLVVSLAIVLYFFVGVIFHKASMPSDVPEPPRQWTIHGKEVPLACFERNWANSKNFAGYSSAYPMFDPLRPGESLGRDFTIETLSGIHEGQDGYSLVANLEDCVAWDELRAQSHESVLSDYRNSYYTENSEVISVGGVDECQKYAPNWKDFCKSTALVILSKDYTKIAIPPMGVYGEFNIDGKTFIAPLVFYEEQVFFH